MLSERHESPQHDDLSRILARASQTPDDDRRLKELIAGVTQEPRAAINHIEQEIGSLREMMAMREQALLEAIDEHTKLSKEAVHGLGVVRKALGRFAMHSKRRVGPHQRAMRSLSPRARPAPRCKDAQAVSLRKLNGLDAPSKSGSSGQEQSPALRA